MVVFKIKAISLKSEIPHPVVVVGANRVKVRSGGELFKVLLGLLHRKDFLDTVKVITNIVFVLEHT